MSKINPIRWSTKKIKELMVQIEQSGTIPRYNPFYNLDANLLASGINFGMTEEEMLDKAKVVEDVFYFATTHAKVKTDEGVTQIKTLRNYQKNLLHHFNAYRFNVVLASRQIGKCVHAFTHIDVEIDGTKQNMPIFEVYYHTLKNPSSMDKLQHWLLRQSYRFALVR